MNKQSAAQSSSTKTRYGAYCVTKLTRNNKEESNWKLIGVAFPHLDCKGFNVALDAVRVKGELVIREIHPTQRTLNKVSTRGAFLDQLSCKRCFMAFLQHGY